VVQHTPVRFPNGNVTMFPSDIYFFFECQSLENASPSFLANVGVVACQDQDVSQEFLFNRMLKHCEQKHQKFFRDYRLDFNEVKKCTIEFLIPFIAKLNRQPMITAWSLWDLKALTLQFFVVLNAIFYRLADNC